MNNIVDVTGYAQFSAIEYPFLNGTKGDEWPWRVLLKTQGSGQNIVDRCRAAWGENRACYIRTNASNLPFHPDVIQGLQLSPHVLIPITAISKEKMEDELGFLHPVINARVNLGIIKMDESAQ